MSKLENIKNKNAMHIEITPFWYDSMACRNDVHSGNTKDDIDYYKKGEPIVIKLEDIKRLSPNPVGNGTNSLTRLKFSDDYHDDILVSAEEGQKIKKMLLNMPENDLSKAIRTLNMTLRNLYDILRARLH